MKEAVKDAIISVSRPHHPFPDPWLHPWAHTATATDGATNRPSHTSTCTLVCCSYHSGALTMHRPLGPTASAIALVAIAACILSLAVNVKATPTATLDQVIAAMAGECSFFLRFIATSVPRTEVL